MLYPSLLIDWSKLVLLNTGSNTEKLPNIQLRLWNCFKNLVNDINVFTMCVVRSTPNSTVVASGVVTNGKNFLAVWSITPFYCTACSHSKARCSFRECEKARTYFSRLLYHLFRLPPTCPVEICNQHDIRKTFVQKHVCARWVLVWISLEVKLIHTAAVIW